MVFIKALLLTSVIDVFKFRDVVITDIPCVYLTTDIDEEVHMILEGKLAEIMVLIAIYKTARHILFLKGNKSSLMGRSACTLFEGGFSGVMDLYSRDVADSLLARIRQYLYRTKLLHLLQN